MALSRIVGMPSGRILPLLFGIETRLSGCGLYPRCFSLSMACCFAAGVFQVSLSTPAVRFPWFSVTRLTARALPLNEWVSRRCKAFTFPHLPSFVAFTIRAWSRRTFWLTCCQCMACQSSIAWETALAWFAIICFVSLIGLPGDLVRKDLVEVCPLSRGVMLLSRNPYPCHYSSAFAFSTFLY